MTNSQGSKHRRHKKKAGGNRQNRKKKKKSKRRDRRHVSYSSSSSAEFGSGDTTNSSDEGGAAGGRNKRALVFAQRPASPSVPEATTAASGAEGNDAEAKAGEDEETEWDAVLPSNLFMLLLTVGFVVGLAASHFYYHRAMSQREEKFRTLLDLYSNRKASSSFSLAFDSPVVVVVLVVLPVVVFGTFLYRRQLLLKRKEEERKQSQRKTYGLLASMCLTALAMKLYGNGGRGAREDSTSGGSPLLAAWRSMGYEIKTIIGIGGFLAVLRQCQGSAAEASCLSQPHRRGSHGRRYHHSHHSPHRHRH